MFGLKDKVLAYVGGGLALALLIALTAVTLTKNATIHTLEKQATQRQKALDACNADRTTLRNNQAALQSSITEQNRSISVMAAAAAAKQDAAAPERSAAASAAASAHTRADTIAKAKPVGTDKAAAADTLILESLK